MTSKALRDNLYYLLRNLTAPVPRESAETLLGRYAPAEPADCTAQRPEGWEADAACDLSIIIPVFNSEKYLRTCMDSVLHQQTEYTYEVIAVNDGSSDSSWQILQEYAARANVRLLTRPNGGAAAARNSGILASKGRYFLFHDADDRLLPGAVQNLLECAYAHDADLVAGSYLCEDMDGKLSDGERFPSGPITDHSKISGIVGGKLYRRNLFAGLAFPEGYWFEDSIVSQIIFPRMENGQTLETPVFAYLQNESGMSAAARANPRSMESFFITRDLLAQQAVFGIACDAQSFDYFLRMVLLTYHRTRMLSADAVFAAFAGQQMLYQKYFAGSAPIPRFNALISALKKNSYRRYVWCCEFQWILDRLNRS